MRYGSFPEQRLAPSDADAVVLYERTQARLSFGPYQVDVLLDCSMSLAAQVTTGAAPVAAAANGCTRFWNQAWPELDISGAPSTWPGMPFTELLVPSPMMAAGVPAPWVL